MKIFTWLKLPIIGFAFPVLLSACGGQYAGGGERSCTWNTTACTQPAAYNCCSNWGYSKSFAPAPSER